MFRASGSQDIATARAGTNIAFIKYWGVADPELNLPLSNSISMTLASAVTTTTVRWDTRANMYMDEVTIDGETLFGDKASRVVRHLDYIRELAGGVPFRAKVVSQNNFPMASGIASSASGFAALTVAACAAIGLRVEKDRLSAIARRGSGSARRSIFGGFVEWEQGREDNSSVAHQLYPEEHWNLRDVIVVVDSNSKHVSSQRGHVLAATSPFNVARIDRLFSVLQEVRTAIATCDLDRLGPIIERDALAMHGVMMTSNPSLIYWQPATVEVIKAVRRWRDEDNLRAYFTIDAGPNVHIICEPSTEPEILLRLKELSCVEKVITSGPGPEPELLKHHLIK
ncbi:MAG: diphosphomevalonate decarboxylase [Caldilineaceae bacterium]|nr:diphosphomevalonate decarboxylase [Caldilineaceae bacterium]